MKISVVLACLILLAACEGDSRPGSGGTAPGSGEPTGGCASAEDNAMLRAVNAARAQGRQCGQTSFGPAAPLDWSCSLARAASGHSSDMATHNFFSHTGSDGLRVGERATEAGYRWRMIGENIAWGQRDVDAVMQGWLASAGHCENIMRPGYREMGVGRASDVNGRPYWTQVFGTPR